MSDSKIFLDKTDLYAFIFIVFDIVTCLRPTWIPGQIFYKSTIKRKEIIIDIRSIDPIQLKSLIQSLHYVSNYSFVVEIEHLIISQKEIKIQFTSVSDFIYIRSYNYPTSAWDSVNLEHDYDALYEEIIPPLSEVSKIS